MKAIIHAQKLQSNKNKCTWYYTASSENTKQDLRHNFIIHNLKSDYK